MRRRLLSFIFALLTVFSFASSSFAHSGRTDSNGGHWDKSTGTYHYHNGSSSINSSINSSKSSSKQKTTTVKPSTSSSSSNLSKYSKLKKYPSLKSNSNSTSDSSSSVIEKGNSKTVYVSNNGKIHIKSNCSGMKYYTKMTYKEAIDAGYVECKKCYE